MVSRGQKQRGGWFREEDARKSGQENNVSMSCYGIIIFPPPSKIAKSNAATPLNEDSRDSHHSKVVNQPAFHIARRPKSTNRLGRHIL